MSFYFREKPRFGDKLRGKSRDELMQELKQQFDDDKSFFEPPRVTRDPFERHTGFSRGFPFDDVEGFGRRSSDIRSHLDDLASRHPEFADHLLGSAWGDIPAFHNTGSLRSRRRRGSGGSSSYQGNPDEDARSQTSGSSANSAASGASGVSSHGDKPNASTNVYSNESREPSVKRNNNNNNNSGSNNTNSNSQTTRRNPIPQYGLRNTVDIGQHRHDMDNPERGTNDNRGQRSMSAPPENRERNEVPSFTREKQEQQGENGQNQRFVSRVDITPQFGQPAANEKSAGLNQQPAANQQQKHQQQSNVRHIPIFVEGRDEPVVPKNIETDQTDGSAWTYSRPQRTDSPPQFHPSPQFPPPPPQFHRPSHFNQHYAGGRARDWLPNFEEEFYAPQSSFQQAGPRKQPFTSHSPPRQGTHFRHPQTETKSRQNNESPSFNQQSQQSQPQQQQQQQQQQEIQEPRKQTQPKDPLEKVADVQKEVDSLNEQVNLWNGQSRKDKDYMYLDEMLTRELIKLDDIETEGKDNVRQARKNAIKSIQDSISLLESKAPLPNQSGSQRNMEIRKEEASEQARDSVENTESAIVNEEKNNDSDKEGMNEQQTPIPLPAAPVSPTKEPVPAEFDDTTERSVIGNENNPSDQPSSAGQDNSTMDVAVGPVVKVSSIGSMEIPETEQRAVLETTPVIVPETLMEVENPKSPKATKKIRKTKKQQQQQQAPISDGAIPLPAPDSHRTGVAK